MTLREIGEAVEKIGCLTITTSDQGTLHSRIIHMCGCDDEGIYFLTMNVKPFHRQLVASGQVALCGMYPSSRATGRNVVGQPAFPPGFTFRLTGEAREVPEAEIREKAAAGNRIFAYALADAARYPAMRLFRIHRGRGEIFDYDFEMEHRDHKLLRTRFAFGGETFAEPGCVITDECVGCGACADVCSFKAIEPGEPYRINGARCDECGSCMLACPQDAIRMPDTL